MKIIICFAILTLSVFVIAFEISGDTRSWEINDFIGFDDVGDCSADIGDITSSFAKIQENTLFLRITFDDMHQEENLILQDNFKNSNIKLQIDIKNNSKLSYSNIFDLAEIAYKINNHFLLRTPKSNLLEISLDWNNDLQMEDLNFQFAILVDDVIVDQYSANGSRDYRGGNCAFVHHGNQGLTYTEVFRGQYPQDDSGFDEVLEIHQNTGIPGNFHMSGTLMNAAMWHDEDFNTWLRTGINDGWAAMLTSAYGQHIMPFMDNAMNDWAVSTQKDMVQYVYNYDAKVAWIPERVWLAPGNYPDSGVIDWLGDNWTQHGVNAVILDDWPHCSGADNKKIHWMNNGSGINLRVIPIDNEFVGKMHYDANGAKNHISGTGQYGICVYGTDWEVVAEMNEHSGTYYLENYIDVINYCNDNYPAVNVWKLDSAIENTDFNGWGIDLQNGTYGMLGGADGYGGNNNSWYSNWAGNDSHNDFHDPVWDYGTVWWNTFQNVVNSPNNNIAQLGWFTMMTNLHETGWHDGDPSQISGWIHRYASHIKNANVYEEASRWYNNEYTITTNAFMTDIDLDGGDELIIHNDKLFMVFEGIGGKANWIFTRDCGGACVVGSDNVYWSETDGDYNESSNNHFAALSDVSPNYQDNIYTFQIDNVTATEAQISLYNGIIHKSIQLNSGNNFAEVTYYANETDVYIKSGWTPDYLSTLWNVNWERIWDADNAYMGQKNSNSGATVSYILNNGGASHNGTFEGTYLKGDEIRGYDQFKFLLYAGWTDNILSELENLQSLNLDAFPPELNPYAQQIDENTFQIEFNEGMDNITGELLANYQLTGFSNSYTINSIERQSNWNLFWININEILVPGDNGNVIVNNIEDLNGNPVANNSSASLSIPSGITPHMIFIDGSNDFDPVTEFIQSNDDSLFITWDADNLYVGFSSFALNDDGDLFINIDIDQTSNSGAEVGSWARVDFAGIYLPEYQIAIEGGGGSIQLNSWSDAGGWSYLHHPANGCYSYEGWTDNPYSEISIPWSGLGNPTGIAISMHATEEDNEIVSNIFPTNNPIGNHPIIQQAFMFYQPEISGNMPLMGFEPYSVEYSEIVNLVPPDNIQISISNDEVQISWSSVSGATSYKVYSSDEPCSGFSEDTTGSFSGTSWGTDIMPIKKFYYVKAVN